VEDLGHESSPYSSLPPLFFGGDGTETQAYSCRLDVVADLEMVPDAEGPMAERSLA